nr:DUF11 domain-containing protein [Microbacterium sp. NC79]
MQVTSLEFDNWVCSANDTAPIDGPASLECTYGEALAASDSVALNLPIVVTASPVTVSGTVSSPLHDDDNTNNEATVVNAAAAPLSGLTVVKDDAVPAAAPGQLLTYTINASNQLIAEPLADVSIVDALPANMEFVSASDGGSFDGTEVTWNVAELAAAASAQVSVTVRVLDAAGATSLQNSVVASASDPAFTGVTLSGQATDTNHIDRIALTKTASLQAPASAQDPRAGDVVEYTIVASNVGGGTITGVDITDAMAGLSALDFPAGWPTVEGTLAAGESVTTMATYVLTEEDIDTGSVANAANVVVQSGGGEQVAASATATMPLPAVSALSFTKSASLDTTDDVRAGDTITYTFEISSDSNVTVHAVSIDDDLAGLSTIDYDWPRGVGVLAAGESVTAVATYVLTQADLDRGLVSNTATRQQRALSTSTTPS